MASWRRLGWAAMAAVVAGCTVGPDFKRPAPAAQNGFPDQALGRAGAGDVQQSTAAAADIRADWWTLLASPPLDAVERQALADNWTLAARQAAIARARQALAAVHGEDYPALAAQGQIGQTRIGATVFGPDAYSFPIFSAYGAGLSAAYDPDLFGGRRRRVEAAGAAEMSEVHERDAVALTLVGNVALQAIAVAEATREIELTNQIVASDEQTLTMVRQAHASGASPTTDVELAAATADQDRARIPAQRQRLQTAQDALAVLVGRSPTDWRPPAFHLDDFTLPSALPTTVPSVLARRRPDILAAEDRLHAANAAIGVATADLYPRVELSADVAREGLFNGPSETAWTLLGGVAAPIFNGGRLLAAKRQAQAAYRQSFAEYQDVVVTSLAQVSEALNALANDADALAAEEQARASADRSLTLVRQGYAAGGADLVQVLKAQRLLDDAEIGVEQARADRLANTVRLFVALGIHPPAWAGAQSRP